MKRYEIGRIGCALLLGLLLPAAASAQSTIAGMVTDATGGVLPGVTVEAASPALIEKVRAVTTDAEGRYSIVDVRPGTYTVTFTLTGFTTVRREGIQVESNVNVPISAELRVGAVEETITVSGETPVVDIQTVARRETINREQIEVLPTTRNAAHMLQLQPGVRAVLTNGRAGLQGATENVFVTGRGLTMYDTLWFVDGMDARTGNLSGLANLRLNDAMVEETTFTTSGSSIESPTGGVSLNLIPRDGGNRFSGNFVALGNFKSWVGNNLSQELIDRGATVTTTLGANSDGSLAAGGPITRDRLWFYTAWRHQSTSQFQGDEYTYQPGVRDESNWFLQEPLSSWEQLEELSANHNMSLRLTSHLSQGQKLTAYYDRTFNRDSYNDIAGFIWQPWSSSDYLGQLKYTNTVSSKLLFEAGYSFVSYSHHKTIAPLLDAPRFSDQWIATAVRQDLNTGRQLFEEYLDFDNRFSKRRTFSSGLTYVTGSHSLKTGIQMGNAFSDTHRDINGAAVYRYRTGVSDSITAYNHPAWARGDVDLDLGVYAGDTWSIKRLTLTGGARFDHFDAGIHAYGVPAGRFVKLRDLPAYQAPIQNNVSARIGATYDLFGGAKTALKFSYGKYLANLGELVGEAVNPASQQTTTLTWNDGNKDGIAQDSELENIATVNPNFYNGIIPTSYDPNWKREYNYEMTFGAQHQLRPGLAVNAMFYHRQRYNLQVSDRTAVRLSDYFPVDVAAPGVPSEGLAPSVITVYNLPNELRAVYNSSPVVIRAEENSDISRTVYTGIEFSLDGRLPGGGRMSGGLSLERTVNVACALQSNKNLQRNCDESRFDIPLRPEFKLTGVQPVPGGFDASIALNSVAGLARPVLWNVTRTLRYSATCTGPCRPGDLVINNPPLNAPTIALNLADPGTSFLDRYTDLTIGVSRVFNLPKGRIRAGLDVFNSLNGSAVITQTTDTASTSYGTPSVTQEPRVFRATVRYQF